MTKIGTKYQVVIGREARKKLGIEPGWEAVETVVGDRLEIRFLPPEHDRSLAGELEKYADRSMVKREDEERMAWEDHVSEEWGS